MRTLYTTLISVLGKGENTLEFLGITFVLYCTFDHIQMLICILGMLNIIIFIVNYHYYYYFINF